ncbi:hypothetical protein, conserved [Plasmodium gonderi]|uniref:Variable surface protein n=1 Tax=Plasmodium gonderi TaxID=77519 RepID=A0A1Y1JDV8_PLAGO|nr:hypothetical protein, conserved [Plasmodium gonderi]GAW79397.1 hypothetical protein, conserved [Plasmodium gonderi]
MADDYDYEHVKTFPTYASKLNDVDHFSGIQFRTNDPIVNRCKEKAKSNENFYYIMLCATLNKYFKYYSHLNPVDSKHCEYINFWLNKKSQYDNSFNIYKRIINHDKSLDIFDPSIKDIQEYESKLGVLSNEVVRKINTIYKLNEQYLFFLTKKEIGQTAKVILCDHAKKFAEIYNEAIGECSNYNNKYCKALIEFKVKYDKHKEFTKTCQEVKDVKIIPGTESYELEILRRYGLFSRYGFNSVTDVLKTAGKVLGGVFVLFLIIKNVIKREIKNKIKKNLVLVVSIKNVIVVKITLSMKIMIIMLVMVVIIIMKTMIIILVMVVIIIMKTMIIILVMVVIIIMKTMIIILVMVDIQIMKTMVIILVMVVIIIMKTMVIMLIMVITMIILIIMIITIIMKIKGIRFTIILHITMITINQCRIMDNITFNIILHVMMNICTTEIKQYSELVNNVIKSNDNYIKAQKKKKKK